MRQPILYEATHPFIGIFAHEIGHFLQWEKNNLHKKQIAYGIAAKVQQFARAPFWLTLFLKGLKDWGGATRLADYTFSLGLLSASSLALVQYFGDIFLATLFNEKLILLSRDTGLNRVSEYDADRHALMNSNYARSLMEVLYRYDIQNQKNEPDQVDLLQQEEFWAWVNNRSENSHSSNRQSFFFKVGEAIEEGGRNYPLVRNRITALCAGLKEKGEHCLT